MTYDVAIAGGGHVGLALALAFSRATGGEVRIVVVERTAPPSGTVRSPDPRAFALSAGSKQLLDVLGVWGTVAAHAEPVTAIDITDSGLGDAIRPVLLSYDNQIGAGEPATYILEADTLLDALRRAAAAAPGVTLLAPAEPKTLHTGPGAVTLELADGRVLETRLLVGAEGRRSFVREAAAIPTLSWSHKQTGIATTIAHDKPHEGRAVQHFLPGGPFALLPLKGNRSCITWSEASGAAERAMALDDAGFLAEIDRRVAGRLGRISLAGPRGSWPLSFVIARRLTAPRVAIVGDAAHGVHPIAGQGLNLGLKDVAALAEVVTEGLRVGLDAGDATALARYERWRRFDNASSLAAYSALNVLFSNDWTLLRAARGVGLGVVDRLVGLKKVLVDEAAGLTGNVPRLLKGEPI